MSNRRLLNKTIAKIQAILGLAFVLFSNTACERKDLFLRVDQTQIAVEIYDINLDLLWGIEWDTQWQYDWDTSLETYGDLGYTKPELIKGTIYNTDEYTGKRYSSFVKIFDSNGGRVSLTSGSTYDMMFYNFGTEWTSFYQSDDYETYTASTRMSSQSSWIRTRAETESSEMPDTTRSYIDYNQPDELFGTLKTGIYIDEDPSTYDKEYDEDGNITYIYKIDATLRPYSFIYIYQVIITNNTDEKGDIIKGSRGMTITGLSQGVEMFSRRTFNNTISITTDDVKPMQRHKNVKLEGEAVADSADIIAARILTWGLPGMNPLENTKAATKAPDIDRNFIGVGLTLRNGYTWTITRDITEQMHEHPTGGIITIYVDAKEVPEDIINQKPQSTGGGFNAEVENWSNEVNAEVTI
jgi:hypothetical protein